MNNHYFQYSRENETDIQCHWENASDLTFDRYAVVIAEEVENAAEPTDVPAILILVRQRAGDVSAVYRVNERYVLPVLPLQILVAGMSRRSISAKIWYM